MRVSTIAIVGGGASGALVAAQVARQARVPVRVILYEADSRLGAGVAYGTSCLAHLLNVPAGRMSAYPEQPDHFLQWLNDPANCAELVLRARVLPADFVPRAMYGRYLAGVVRDAFAAKSCVARLDRRAVRAVDFVPSRYGGTVVSADAETEDVSHVVLALGNQPPCNPLKAAHPFFESARYVSYVWQASSLCEAPDEPVLIVGTGLTAVDAALRLREEGHRGPIIVTSRGGRFPQSHQAFSPGPDWLAGRERPGTIRRWLREVRREIRESGRDWRAVIDALRPYTQEIWMGLSQQEHGRFLRHARIFWESHRHRMPPAAARCLEDLRSSGILQLKPGRIRDFVEDEKGVTVFLQPRGASGNIALHVSRVINCIGPESNFRQHLNDPLIVNLMARGIIHPDPLFLGLDATPEGVVVGAEGKRYPMISLLGPPLRGILWETTAMPEIRVQASRAARQALAGLEVTSWEI